MSQQQETTTDRLISIIQLIQLGRRTGQLMVKRGDGLTLEEGIITFAKGQVSQAKVERRNGSEALNWLSTWGNCRFVFVSADGVEIPLSPPSAPFGNVSGENRDTPLPPINAEFAPAAQYSNPSPPKPAVPQRTIPPESALRLIEQMGLSRTHRHLFLLIDGHRSSEELVRLMGRTSLEVEGLLHDLERAAIIRLSSFFS